jgi:uncharacterized membrane protein
VGIAVPKLADDTSSREPIDQLHELLPNTFAFFIVFFVVGSCGVAHHRFVGWLASIDSWLLHVQLVYFAVIDNLVPAGP